MTIPESIHPDSDRHAAIAPFRSPWRFIRLAAWLDRWLFDWRFVRPVIWMRERIIRLSWRTVGMRVWLALRGHDGVDLPIAESRIMSCNGRIENQEIYGKDRLRSGFGMNSIGRPSMDDGIDIHNLREYV